MIIVTYQLFLLISCYGIDFRYIKRAVVTTVLFI